MNKIKVAGYAVGALALTTAIIVGTSRQNNKDAKEIYAQLLRDELPGTSDYISDLNVNRELQMDTGSMVMRYGHCILATDFKFTVNPDGVIDDIKDYRTTFSPTHVGYPAAEFQNGFGLVKAYSERYINC